MGQSGTISDAMDELSHGAFAPFTSRDGIDGGMNKLNDKRGSSFVPDCPNRTKKDRPTTTKKSVPSLQFGHVL